ncbi:MAG TPA: hypothetical protein DCQ16_09500 [Spirochaetaceae bacterium]|nr:hypothetical protein [Spirochaetaceae bacterium]
MFAFQPGWSPVSSWGREVREKSAPAPASRPFPGDAKSFPPFGAKHRLRTQQKRRVDSLLSHSVF